MRTIRGRSRSLLVVALGLAMAAGTAAGQPKKGGAPKGGTTAPKGGGAGSGSAAGSGAAGDEGIEIEGEGSGAGSGSGSGTIDMEQEEEKPAGSLEAELNATETNTAVKTGPVKKTPLSWKDILVVVRKPFLKLHRTELFPFVGTTMNDNMITHYTLGGEFAYWMTDVLAVGVEGQYYQHSFGEPYDLVARQTRRLHCRYRRRHRRRPWAPWCRPWGRRLSWDHRQQFLQRRRDPVRRPIET